LLIVKYGLSVTFLKDRKDGRIKLADGDSVRAYFVVNRLTSGIESEDAERRRDSTSILGLKV